MKLNIMNDTNKQFKSIDKEISKQWIYRKTSPIKLQIELAKKLINRPWIISYEYHIFDDILEVKTNLNTIHSIEYECDKLTGELITSNHESREA